MSPVQVPVTGTGPIGTAESGRPDVPELAGYAQGFLNPLVASRFLDEAEAALPDTALTKCLTPGQGLGIL